MHRLPGIVAACAFAFSLAAASSLAHATDYADSWWSPSQDRCRYATGIEVFPLGGIVGQHSAANAEPACPIMGGFGDLKPAP